MISVIYVWHTMWIQTLITLLVCNWENEPCLLAVVKTEIVETAQKNYSVHKMHEQIMNCLFVLHMTIAFSIVNINISYNFLFLLNNYISFVFFNMVAHLHHHYLFIFQHLLWYFVTFPFQYVDLCPQKYIFFRFRNFLLWSFNYYKYFWYFDSYSARLPFFSYYKQK